MSEMKIIDIKNTINDWAGNQITIRKEENEDLDQINIQLEKATFEQRDSVDDYIADNVMFLHGTAYSTEDGEKTELPSVLYEVPLDGIEEINTDQSIITFKTSRGQYAIMKS
ncbi:hypothetical protein GA0061096_0090 [Fictibacillus enclensis]|uniref:Uncharacterized protein n=1 Tax=Fictibacillus enclensis TaxID=1017270 RepID=A0A0V8JAQ4_9BACL|nr:hypothetical protein [Fictibacillus enclensis]KSU84073.1 hypothetical protein AS030_00420 [Fictibacillus enclensis]WHY73246.1 hypothetical protein QNH15_04835 [Fictibacillus enclensis]SCB72683.1 hypothetical protein GA0061096_0090 [Fictibacillus enclensis]